MPDFSFEDKYVAAGPVCGMDEAGCGPLAGPVVAACVHIGQKFDALKYVADSKKLSHAQREELFTEITHHCAFGIALSTVEEIDQINIYQANMQAMDRAFTAMEIGFDFTPATLLIDGNRIPKQLVGRTNTHSIVKGDDKSLSIACASILAKVTRDRLMNALHDIFPHYGWATNAGYSTPFHLEALNRHGPCEHHRRSFAPVKTLLAA